MRRYCAVIGIGLATGVAIDAAALYVWLRFAPDTNHSW